MDDPAPAPKADLEEVSRNLHAAMRERGKRRKSDSHESGVEVERSGTPVSDGEGERHEDDSKKDR